MACLYTPGHARCRQILTMIRVRKITGIHTPTNRCKENVGKRAVIYQLGLHWVLPIGCLSSGPPSWPQSENRASRCQVFAVWMQRTWSDLCIIYYVPFPAKHRTFHGCPYIFNLLLFGCRASVILINTCLASTDAYSVHNHHLVPQTTGKVQLTYLTEDKEFGDTLRIFCYSSFILPGRTFWSWL